MIVRSRKNANMRKFIPFLLLVLLCGCDIFSLREAEPPATPAPWNYFYTEWGKTLQNLEYAYEDERNLAKYSDLFMPNFNFYFSAQDINDYNITQVWDRDDERDMLYNLHTSSDTVLISLERIPDQSDDTLSTPVRLYRKYNLEVKTGGKTTNYYSGKMELQMVRDNGFWRIFKWYDYRSEDNPANHTWGKLKYDYAV
jgi:hypothetical protein